MSTEITANTDLEALAQRLGVGEAEELRSSRSRREPHLQKYARLLAGMPDIDLSLNPDIAAADMEVGRKVYIPTKEFDQPKTDIPQRTYDLLAQEMLTTHEVGHLLYSDWPTLKAYIDDVEQIAEGLDSSGDPEDWGHIFKEMWNAAEDGIIESELGKAFVVEDEFEITNANMAASGSVAKLTQNERGQDERIYSMKDACIQAMLDLSVYDSGKLDKLLDPSNTDHGFYLSEDANRFREALPAIEQVVDDMMDTPNGKKRNKVFFDFFEETIIDLIDMAEVDGTRDAKDDDMLQEGQSDDAQEAIGEAQEELEFAPEEVSAGSGDEEGQGDEEAQAEQQVQEQAEETLQREAMEAVGEDMMDEIEEFQQILQEGTPVNINSIHVPDDKTIDTEIRNTARRVARQIKPIIENQLRESRMEQYSRGRSSGELDTRSMVDAERGSVRVFKRQKDEGDKDYSITLLLDRSGSMGGSIEDTEISVGAFLYALEDLGVDTMCMDFCFGRLRLAKPFGQSVEEAGGRIFTGECGGGTPLTDGLHYARRRVEEGAGTHPAMMVITDGGAGHRDKYREELAKCNIPVIGLYLLPGYNDGDATQMEEAKDFHRFRAVTDSDSLVTTLQQLSREVML